MTERFGYDGFSAYRIVGIKAGRREVLAWCDPPEAEDIAPFLASGRWDDVEFEPVPNAKLELLLHPRRALE